ncbi:hypothetical protein GGP72_003224 [Salinibacter ruber]|nr:hypothetical protein [Salinibacter ruber]MCS3682561.1 hypothetical protein [Salinibacter ruber]
MEEIKTGNASTGESVLTWTSSCWNRLSCWNWLLLAVTVALAPALTGSRDATAQEAQYPSWFRFMPETMPKQTLWAVGYARGYSDLSAGMDSARADAYDRLRRNRQVVLQGEKLYESAPGFQMSFEGGRFTETGLPDTLRSVTFVDSAAAGGMTLVLAAWSPPDSSGDRSSLRKNNSSEEALSKRASQRLGPFSNAPPSWVENGASGPGGSNASSGSGGSGDGGRFGESGRTRAVGRAPRYYYLENSWRRAEKRARRELAFQAASKIERLEKNARGWRHGVMSVQTKARLSRVQTVARWAGGETCYVLVEGTVEEKVTGRD